jgi:uncharacterized protein YceH (UPF0502 family)
VLGVLVEKQKTTDTYPLTLNSVVTGSNQKSNRDPVLTLNDHSAEEALTSLQKNGLVMKVISGRVDKWRHLLYETWQVNSAELAVLTELLLRGPQTEGELRSRASRMEEIASLEALREILRSLAERQFVTHVGPPGKRGTLITHGFHEPQELERLQARLTGGLDDGAVAHSRPSEAIDSGSLDAQWRQLSDHLAQFRNELEAMKANIEHVTAAVRSIQDQLRPTDGAAH